MTTTITERAVHVRYDPDLGIELAYARDPDGTLVITFGPAENEPPSTLQWALRREVQPDGA